MPPKREKTTIRTNVEFVDMRQPNYADMVRALKDAGYSSKRMTKGTRKEIMDSYFKYLVMKTSMELRRSLDPKELEELYEIAGKDVEYYEMYIKQTKVPVTEMEENVEFNLPENFASEENVEKMQNDYAMMSNLVNRMTRSTISNFPKETPQSTFAQSLLLNKQYRLSNWYNYRKAQGMKNSNSDSNDMDGGYRRKSKKRSTRKHKKSKRRVTRYRKRA